MIVSNFRLLLAPAGVQSKERKALIRDLNRCENQISANSWTTEEN
jgi:hypothetical protein